MVIAWARMVPVLSKPPVVTSVAGHGRTPVRRTTEPLRQVKLTAEEPWIATASELISGSVGVAGYRAVIDEGIALAAIHRIDGRADGADNGGTAHCGLAGGHRLGRIDQQ